MYNGKPFDDNAFQTHLRRSAAWRAFVEHPEIDAFFQRLQRRKPFWIPNVRTRGTPPTADQGEERLVFIHQDGAFNAGIPFYVTWVPLAPIPEAMGGVALAEGLHHGKVLHPWVNGTMAPIMRNDIAPDRWRRADYRPGDLLMMDVMTPHSGMTNHTDRFRLSIDLRLLRGNGNHPLIGTIKSIDDHSITVREVTGETVLQIDDDTYCRSFDGKKIVHTEIGHVFKPGMTVIVGREGQRATVVRPSTD